MIKKTIKNEKHRSAARGKENNRKIRSVANLNNKSQIALQRVTTSFPKTDESVLKNGVSQQKTIQRRYGRNAKAADFSVNSNVIGQGLTDGHAWLAIRPVGGGWTTYGTWGNVNPIGLHTNRELGYHPGAATMTVDIDAEDVNAFTAFRGNNNAWSLTNNCASFAGRGWREITGQGVDYTTFFIPNPSALGKGIQSIVGGAGGAGGGSSSSI